MHLNLHKKLLILFLVIAVTALSAAVVVRSFIIHDFRQYVDGDAQDRIVRVIAQLEGAYDKNRGWPPDRTAMELAWALQLGVEVQLYDHRGTPVLNTAAALDLLTPLMRKRLLDATGYAAGQSHGEDIPYPLFLQGAEIGHIDVRLLPPQQEEHFITASQRFLLVSLFLLGVLSFLLSLIAARRLARPISELSQAARDIAEGNLTRRVPVRGHDETAHLATAFNHMAESLEAQEQVRRKLLSGAAHELRTPLAIIAGEVEGMIDGVLPTSREALASIHDETRRLTAILNGIDDLSRAEASRLTLKPEVLPLAPFLHGIGGRFDRLFAEQSSQLSIDCPEGLTVWADPDRLSQVLINLLSNGLKALGPGGLMSLSAAQDQHRTVTIDVKDNGPGILPQDQPYIFERFYTGHGGGMGLGLAIARELIAAHHGDIRLMKHTGPGAWFRITLPPQDT